MQKMSLLVHGAQTQEGTDVQWILTKSHTEVWQADNKEVIPMLKQEIQKTKHDSWMKRTGRLYVTNLSSLMCKETVSGWFS